jgi:hypothetical protein
MERTGAQIKEFLDLRSATKSWALLDPRLLRPCVSDTFMVF